MGATYTRQSTYADGDTITAAHTNDEFDQLLAAFASSSGHTHDGTAAEGGPITKLLGNTLTFGAATSGTDITITFDGESNDGVLKWMEDEDYFEFSDDILVASTEKLQLRDTGIYLYSSTDGQLDVIADGEVAITSPIVDIDASTGIALDGANLNSTWTVNTTNKIQWRDSGLYINSSTDGQLDIVADSEVQIAATTVDINGNVDVSGTLAVAGVLTGASLDISGDIDIDGTTNLDVVDIDGAVDMATTLAVAGNVDFNGDLDVDGTTNLDAVDIDGAVQLDATLTIGANDQGYDVILYGDTASANMTWDTSADDLIFNGAAGLIVPDGQFTLGSTAVSATAAEINLIDGGTARGTTAVASGDGILINDAGTMRMTNVDTVSTYFSSHNVGGSNIVTTGALNSGSITSGFGSIDIGSSALSTTGSVTLGATSFGDNDITNVGDIALDSISADGTDINVAVSDNSATALTIKQGSDAYLIIDTANSSESVSIGTGISGTAISIGHSTSEVTFGDNVTVTGDFTVNGTTSTVATTNLTVTDPLVKYGQGYTGTAYDQGFIVTRGDGSSSNTANRGFIWDESGDEFATIAANTEDGTTAGNVTINDYAPLHVGAITADDNSTFSGEIAAASLDISGNIDIDGTANLDIVDIDGAVDMASTLTVAGVVDITDATDASDATGDTGALRTEGGASIAKKLYVGTDLDVDGTSNLDVVDIDGAVDMASTLTVNDSVTFVSSGSSKPVLTLKNTNADATPPSLTFQKDSSSPAINDEIANINFYGDDDGGNVTAYANLKVISPDVANGSEDGMMTIKTMAGGTLADTLVLASGNTTVSGTLAVAGVLTANAGVVFNEDSADVDFRVESNNSANMLFVDGGNDEVVIQRASSGATATSGSVLVVEDDDNAEISILGGSSSVLALNFGHSGDNNDAKIDYNTTSGSEEMRIFVNAAERMSIDKDGKVALSATAVAKTDTDTSNTGSVTLDFGANQNFVLTLTGNVTLANPSTEQVGQSGFIACIQDGTGSRTLSLGTDYETAGGAGITLTTTASATDLIPYVVIAANRILLGTPQLAFS